MSTAIALARSKFLRVLGQDPERWAARYGIEPLTAACYECGRDLTTSVAFATGDLRGLVAPTCACGNEDTPYCVVRSGRVDLLDGLFW